MKKVVFLVLALITLQVTLWASGYYGQFRDGTGARDTVWMNLPTYDTLGYEANADSVWFWRFYRATLIDSTILTGAGTRMGYYVTGKRAFDGTNYGEYNVKTMFKVQGKYFNGADRYTVFPDSVTGVGRIQTNQDKTNYQLASGQVIARADSVTGVGRIQTNQDKSGYALTQTFPTNFSSLGITADGKIYPSLAYLDTALDNGGGLDTALVGFLRAGIGGAGSCPLTSAQVDSLLLGLWRYSGDSSNFLVDLDSDTLSVKLFASQFSRIADTLNTRYTLSQILTMASLMGGRGNRMLNYYNSSGKLDSVRYYNNSTLVSRLVFYRPTATSAPDSMKMFNY